MDERIKEAFEQVQAESGLKDRTKAYVSRKTGSYRRAGTAKYKVLASAFACVALLLFGGYWLYFTVEISIDVNPSIELGVNRFNRIVSLESYNEDGQALLDSLDIRFTEYSDAVTQIIESEDITSLLSDGEIMTIAVIGEDSTQSKEVLSTVQSCTSERATPIVTPPVQKKYKRRMKPAFPTGNTGRIWSCRNWIPRLRSSKSKP